MLASERSLAPPHQHPPRPKQRRQPPTTTKNGIKKPIRPVKVYVIDPRKFKQQLEACANRTKEKEARTEKEKVLENEEDAFKNFVNSKLSTSVTTPTTTKQKTLSSNKSTSTSTVLPHLVPKLLTSSSSVPASTQTSVTVSQESAHAPILGNGLTLQCISTAGFVPALPLVVTNGIALLQQPIVQSSISSIPTNGIFLPGVAAIPSVISNGATIIGSAAPANIQPKPTPKKKKPKKKKVAKKKKLIVKKEDDDDESELTYLLKETTTRTGRVSRPVSQPHSPTIVSVSVGNQSNSNKINADNNLKNEHEKKKLKYCCETCLEEFASHEKLRSHLTEVPHHDIPDTVQQKATESQSESSPCTNDQQVEVTVPTSNSGSENNTVLSTTFSTSLLSTTPETTLSEPAKNFKESNVSLNNFNLSLHSANAKALPAIASNDVYSCLQYSSMSSLTTNFSRIPYKASSIATEYFPNSQNNLIENTDRSKSTSIYSSGTGISVSLVPISSEELMRPFGNNGSSNTSKIVVVPSSNSIPSSPPSQCQSPGLPDQTIPPDCPMNEGISSPQRGCNSPIDPMLLRSRSPFPPPLHTEVSLPSVSVSNLTIPEESLCKGELFMDLGDGILESTSLSRISPFPCNSQGPIFPSSPTKPASNNNEQLEEVVGPVEVYSEMEQECADLPAQNSPHVSTPVLLETTEDANDGEIFQTANYTRNIFVPPQPVNPNPVIDRTVEDVPDKNDNGQQSPQSVFVESDLSMDSSETVEQNQGDQKRRSIWQFVKDQIKHCGISQACGEISEVAEKLSKIARDQFIPIREDEMERFGSLAPIIHVDTPFFSHLLDLPFGTYIFKEDVGRKKKSSLPPPPISSSELSFTCGVEDVEKFLPPDIDLISLPHLTNLDLN